MSLLHKLKKIPLTVSFAGNRHSETEQTEPPICINFSSFFDEVVCSVPDLEELPNPDSTDLPSFLGQNYENRDCARLLRSNVTKSSFHPFHHM